MSCFYQVSRATELGKLVTRLQQERSEVAFFIFTNGSTLRTASERSANYNCINPSLLCSGVKRTCSALCSLYRDHVLRIGCVRPLSLFYSDASADGVEERSLVPHSRSHARLRRNATMSHGFSCVQQASFSKTDDALHQMGELPTLSFRNRNQLLEGPQFVRELQS
ncbi:hypothetical protein EVAR_76774_1 [Eumeta japonica]|uniref:Uncharacterized protein n=1 Tax=Eumeta variegata TaxID=151549 RepID=A0A4C1SSY5_EUMVA|nr:hypothetical protein EVAR_76774_1 [Eumeta japonica]